MSYGNVNSTAPGSGGTQPLETTLKESTAIQGSQSVKTGDVPELGDLKHVDPSKNPPKPTKSVSNLVAPENEQIPGNNAKLGTIIKKATLHAPRGEASLDKTLVLEAMQLGQEGRVLAEKAVHDAGNSLPSMTEFIMQQAKKGNELPSMTSFIKQQAKEGTQLPSMHSFIDQQARQNTGPLPNMSTFIVNQSIDTMINSLNAPGQQNVQGQQGVGQGQNAFNIPPFPANGTRQEKLDFMIQQLTSPNVRQEGFMSELKRICGDNVKFAGGGQGNVLFIAGTDITLKQNLAGPEKRAYEYFDAARQLFDNFADKDVNTITTQDLDTFKATITNQDLKKCTTGQLLDMLKNQDSIKTGFPVPMTMVSNERNTVVAMKNVNFAEDKESKKIGEINDIKIGARIVSKHELRAHNNSEGRFPGWIGKFITTKIFPFLKGTSSRGYEYVSQKGSGASILGYRLKEGFHSEKIMTKKLKNLRDDQLLSLNRQMEAVSKAHSAMPVTFVGASLMLALPDDGVTNPQACMGDFAHAMFTGEPGIGAKYYGKCKDNFTNGFNNLHDLVKQVMKDRHLV